MKASALAMALVVAASVPAMAQQKKARKAAKKPVAETIQPVDSNEASWRLVKGALPIILPSWSMPLYMKMHGDQAYQDEEKWKQRQQAGQTGQAAQPSPRRKKTAVMR